MMSSKQPDYFEEYDSCMLTTDSLVVPNHDEAKILFFTYKLYIIYITAKEDYGYIRTILSMRKPDNQKSIIYLRSPAPLIIWPNGNYCSPDEVFSKSYLAWLGKISNALPLDYELPINRTLTPENTKPFNPSLTRGNLSFYPVALVGRFRWKHSFCADAMGRPVGKQGLHRYAVKRASDNIQVLPGTAHKKCTK